ncbi:MAG: DHHA1 domain-containing protein [Thermoplasmata archaeon]|nr:DHHA1 domain-containing protein [Thermoplasmata archaeon]
MQHHTATHLLNGALREALGPHVWQAGAYKGLDAARIDITHFRALSEGELKTVERRVNRVIRENRPVKSYFESRSEAERRFGFTLYQGGAVPGRELRIVEIEGFDVEACGGTHCTRTGEVGVLSILSTERIQDGIVRLHYAAGERALDVIDATRAQLSDAAHQLHVPPEQVPRAIAKMLEEAGEARHAARTQVKGDLRGTADAWAVDPARAQTSGGITVIAGEFSGNQAVLMELSRLLTRTADRVAVLTSEVDGRGILFVGSSSAQVPARDVVEGARAAFQGKGGGNPGAATAVGEPGAPLAAARARAIAVALQRAAEFAGEASEAAKGLPSPNSH